MLLVAFLATACSSSQRIVQEQHWHHDTLIVQHHDTLREWHTRHDSVYVHDSTYLQGQQLVKERLLERWHYLHDTVHTGRVDTLFRAIHNKQQVRTKVHQPWTAHFMHATTLLSLLCCLCCGAILYHRIFRR